MEDYLNFLSTGSSRYPLDALSQAGVNLREPQPVKELDYVTYHNNTPYGESGISWKNEEGVFTMELNVPVSCWATVYVPATDLSHITEGVVSADLAAGVTFKEMKDGHAVFEVESGNYLLQLASPCSR